MEKESCVSRLDRMEFLTRIHSADPPLVADEFSKQYGEEERQMHGAISRPAVMQEDGTASVTADVGISVEHGFQADQSVVSTNEPLGASASVSSNRSRPLSRSGSGRSRRGSVGLTSSVRSLARTLTPKKRHPKPILVKAGYRRATLSGTNDLGGGEQTIDNHGQFQTRDLRVTFMAEPATSFPEGAVGDDDLSVDDGHPQAGLSMLSRPCSCCSHNSSSSSSWRHKCACCQHPILPVAGALSLLGGISFGYCMGIISGVLQPVRDRFHLNCLQEQVLVGCLIGGALIVSVCGGPWIDKCGRRRAILIASSFFIFGSCLSAVAPNLDALAAGRLLQGFGMSLSAIAECIYISEIAPKERRGVMVGLNEIGVAVGYLLAFLMAYSMAHVSNSWRILMGLGAAPAVIQLAILILEHLRGTRNEAMNEFATIRHSLVTEGSYGTTALFKSKDNMLFRMLMGFSLVILQQVSGQSSVWYYGSTVLKQVGLSSIQASMANLSMSIIKVVATVIGLYVSDQRGRRYVLIVGCIMMSVSCGIVGICDMVTPASHSPIDPPCHYLPSSHNYYDYNHAKLTFLTPTTVSTMVHSSASAADSSLPGTTVVMRIGHSSGHNNVGLTKIVEVCVIFLSLLVFVAGYSISFAPMVWVILSEVYPAGVKGRAMSFANIVSWSTNLIISLTFLHALSWLTPGGVFVICGVVNLMSALYIYLVVPETKGKSLEGISYELRIVRPKQRLDNNVKWLQEKRARCVLRLRSMITGSQPRPDQDQPHAAAAVSSDNRHPTAVPLSSPSRPSSRYYTPV